MKTATADLRPVHVLIVNSVMTGGGVDSHTLSLCSSLIGQGVQVCLALPAAARLLPRARDIAGLQLLVLAERRQWWPVLLARHIRRNAVQVLHAHHGRDYWVAIMAGWFSLRRPRVVVTRHLMTALKPKTRRLLAPPIRVIAVSDSVVRALNDSDPGRTLSVQRIHCGIDTAVFQPRTELRATARLALGVEPDDLVFVVIGPTQAPDGKGQFYFAAAAAQVLRRCPRARFVCVGDGDAVPALRQESQRLGLGARFTTLAFSDDVPQLLQAIDVLVHPAVNSEALGLVILEALACGKAVVASQLDGISETFLDGKHGLLVPPRDVDALAAAMSTLAGDTERRLAMGAAGRDWVVEHFSLHRLGQDTRRIYEASTAEAAAQSTR